MATGTENVRAALTELKDAINQTDWVGLHAGGKTICPADSAWSANEERCEVLRRLCLKYRASRVLEVGAFCGVSSLSMAEVLPDDGAVVCLEIDPFLADFAKPYLDKVEPGKKVSYVIGPALETLKGLAKKCADGELKPFDFLLIDADKNGLMDYFNLFWYEAPQLLGDQATVCLDITPYKGQAAVLKRGPSSGNMTGDIWVVPSGQDKIDTLRRTLEVSEEHSVYKVAGLLVSHSKEKGMAGSRPGSRVTTPRGNLTHGAFPLAAFPNEHFKFLGAPKWAAPKASDPVVDLRKLIQTTNWPNLYAEGKTMTLVDPDFCGTEERCEVLRTLLADSEAANVLEVGGFCGISTLSMAEDLPDGGQVTSLEIDAFLLSFGDSITEKSAAAGKMKKIAGPAKESLRMLAKQIADDPSNCKPFDFVVIDADRAGMKDYFDLVWKTEGFLAKGATVCVDISPYKGQAPIPYVGTSESGATQWIVPSGQPEVNAIQKYLEAAPEFSFRKISNLLVVQAAQDAAKA
mmetsp:Transcript_46946/g.87401  ORF Transcript_46946/g.87401 Transcript_46946/m.87401 type:complete len:518 (+) Transcript_46946:71-1624(+)